MIRRFLRCSCALAVVVAPAAGHAQRTPQDSARADSAIVLPPITVSVTRIQTPIDVLPFPISLVDQDEIRLGRATGGLDEALVIVPGVVVANRYNQSLDQKISIRGFGVRSAFGVRGVKILLDGVPQTLPDGQGQLSNVELANISRIEVLRGASSTLYGNASGGVISIWRDHPTLDRLAPATRFTAGSYGFRKWVADVGVPLSGRGTLLVTATRTTADGYREHSFSDRRQLETRLLQSLSSETTVRVTALFADAPRLDNPGALTAAQMAEDPRAADPRNVNANAGKAVTQAQAAVTLDHRFNGGARASATVFGLRRDLENPLAFAFIQLDRWAYGARAVTTIPAKVGRLNQTVTVGLDAQWQRDDRVNYTTDRSTRTLTQLERVFEFGPFLQTMVPLGSRTTVTAGARYDRVRFQADDRLLTDGSDDSGARVMANVSATAGLTFALTPHVRPYANVGTSFETPTTTELVNRPDGEGGFNPDLEPQTATNVEIGLRGTIAARARFGLAAFYSRVRNQLIPFEVPGSPNRQFFRNAGAARHAGAEIELSLQPAAGVTVVAAYSYSNHQFTNFRTATDTLDNNKLPGIPRHYGHVSLRYRSSRGWWVTLDNTSSSSFFADDGNETTNEGWTTTGIRAGWNGNVAEWRLAPFVGLLNVFDDGYASSVVINARGGRYFEPAPPRNVYVGLSLGRAR